MHKLNLTSLKQIAQQIKEISGGKKEKSTNYPDTDFSFSISLNRKERGQLFKHGLYSLKTRFNGITVFIIELTRSNPAKQSKEEK